MSGPATLRIEIESTADAAQADLRATGAAASTAETAVRELGKAFDQAADDAKEFGRSAESVDEVGGASAKTAGALGDLGGAFELIGQSGVGDKLGIIGTIMMAGAGIADLYTVGIQGAKAAMAALQSGAALAAARTIALSAAQKLAAVGTAIWTGIQWALNAAMLANPIGLIILAIIALIAIIILVVKNWDTLKRKTLDVWATIKGALLSAWQWIKRNVFDPIGRGITANIEMWKKLVATVKDVWGRIKQALSDNALTRAIQTVIDKLKEFVNFFTNIHIPDWLNPGNWFASNAALATGGRAGLFRRSSLAFRQIIDSETSAGRATRLETRAMAAAIRTMNDSALVVNVFLDGKRVGGYVRGIVMGALNDDGALLTANAWGN